MSPDDHRQHTTGRTRRRSQRVTVAATAIVVVIIIVVVLVVVKVTGGGSSKQAAPKPDHPQRVISLTTSVPPSTLAKADATTIDNPPQPIKNPTTVTAQGKPKVLYVGAEFCPFCAAQRWSMVVALSRFGTFSGLGLTRSAADDVHPNTPTLSFNGSSYTSRFVAFSGVETTDRQRQPLEPLEGTNKQLFTTYDAPPYVPSDAANAIPFILIAGHYVTVGAAYSPDVLRGKTHLQIAKALHDPSSDIAQAVNAEANLLTAAICEVTDNKPAKVCQAPGVTAAAGVLDHG